MPLIQYGQVTSGVAEFSVRITEASDTRITEAGDTRITNDETINVIMGSLGAEGTLIVPFREMYYKVSGAWKVAVPYIKDNGTWKEPLAVYVKQNGKWIRTL